MEELAPGMLSTQVRLTYSGNWLHKVWSKVGSHFSKANNIKKDNGDEKSDKPIL